MDTPSFAIYNASAGSGKTYALSKAYLKLLFQAKGQRQYRHILALTFTNKAVNEMKERILENLLEFSLWTGGLPAPDLLQVIATETGQSPKRIGERSKIILKEILHNYAFFDIATIDRFTHRLIRTFAKDLELPQNFEVVLDVDLLLAEAVSRVIDKAGRDSVLTETLVQFALDKIDDDRSWNIAYDLNKMGKKLFNENHSSHLSRLAQKSPADFQALKVALKDQIVRSEQNLIGYGKEVLQLMEANGLQRTDFYGGYLPAFFQKLANGDYAVNVTTAWIASYDTKPLYTKKAPLGVQEAIDGIRGELGSILMDACEQILHRNFLLRAYKNIVPLSLLHAIQMELKTIQKERDEIPLFEFNKLIAKEIQGQPAPFIYERLGERYRHYFIDEFQDTSEMQWENLIPLAGSALEGEDLQGNRGSLFLVGDAKQAIYRWRGGKAEQLMDLYTGKSTPFVLPAETFNLDTNYRSCATIIDFNNTFFSVVASFLEEPQYQEMYLEGNRQQYNHRQGGLVQLDILEKTSGKEEKNEQYCQRTLALIREIQGQDYSLADICILVRKNGQAQLLADFLVQQGLQVVSPDALLLHKSDAVVFLVGLLQYVIDPASREVAFELLSFLTSQESDKHAFIADNLKGVEAFLLREYQFDLQIFRQRSVYDAMEMAIRQFGLYKMGQDAYLTAFLDAVLQVEYREGSSPQAVLEYWESKGDSLTIPAQESRNAVQIMTIHKSKGLQFPIVICPFVEGSLFGDTRDSQLWVPVPESVFPGFQEMLFNTNKEFITFGDIPRNAYLTEQNRKALDSFNVLYVAFTRAVKGLFILTENDTNKQGKIKQDAYFSLFVHFLEHKGLWDVDRTSYVWGQLWVKEEESMERPHRELALVPTYKDRPEFEILATGGSLWGQGQDEALDWGNLLHNLLSLVEEAADVPKVIQRALVTGALAVEQQQAVESMLLKVVGHEDLKFYFSGKNRVLNERELLTSGGTILRPDRLVFMGDQVAVLDYKTGMESESHKAQLMGYADTLRSMGYKIKECILIYIGKEDLVLKAYK